MLSFSTRLLISASVVLATFTGLTGLALDRAFQDSAQSAVKERLQAQVYMLLGVVDVDVLQRLSLPKVLPEARFSTPDSGLYADVMDAKGNLIWRSPSLLGRALPFFPALRSEGDSQFAALPTANGEALFVLAFTVSWEITPERYQLYTFRVAESQWNYLEQLSSFRRSLWGWLLAASAVLLAVQVLILRWSLQPLRRVATEVNEIEAGQRRALSSDYPPELQLLTTNLNTLVRQGHSMLERYRNALGDLAHSLKTPLAGLRSALENQVAHQELQRVLTEQVERMHRTIDYQLQRAAAAGPIALTKPIAVAVITTRIFDSLAKVYAGRSLQMHCAVPAHIVFYGDEGDLMEMLGNAMDNACKWARQQVVVRAWTVDAPARSALVIEIEDDGAGIPAAQVPLVLHRGQRADPQVAGHGIGLAVIRDLVEEVYCGKLEITYGELGGALVRMRLGLPV